MTLTKTVYLGMWVEKLGEDAQRRADRMFHRDGTWNRPGFREVLSELTGEPVATQGIQEGDLPYPIQHIFDSYIEGTPAFRHPFFDRFVVFDSLYSSSNSFSPAEISPQVLQNFCDELGISSAETVIRYG
jgi:hypothetical protein